MDKFSWVKVLFELAVWVKSRLCRSAVEVAAIVWLNHRSRIGPLSSGTLSSSHQRQNLSFFLDLSGYIQYAVETAKCRDDGSTHPCRKGVWSNPTFPASCGMRRRPESISNHPVPSKASYSSRHNWRTSGSIHKPPIRGVGGSTSGDDTTLGCFFFRAHVPSWWIQSVAFHPFPIDGALAYPILFCVLLNFASPMLRVSFGLPFRRRVLPDWALRGKNVVSASHCFACSQSKLERCFQRQV